MSLAITSLYMGNDAVFLEMLPIAQDVARATGDPIELAVVNAYRIPPYLPTWTDAQRPSRRRARRTLDRRPRQDAQASGCPHQLALAYLGRLAFLATSGRRDDARGVRHHVPVGRGRESNKRVLDNAPSGSPSPTTRRSRRSPAAAARAPTSYLETGYWGILDFALSDLLGPLLSLRRDRGPPSRLVRSDWPIRARLRMRRRSSASGLVSTSTSSGLAAPACPRRASLAELLDEIERCVPVARSEPTSPRS